MAGVRQFKVASKKQYGDPQFFQLEEDMSSNLLHYGDAIDYQTRLASVFLTRAIRGDDLTVASNAVDVLESLVIRQVKDKIYQAQIKALIKNTEEKWNSLSNRDKKRYYEECKRQYVLSKFRLLTSLMGRVGLSYVQDVSIQVGETKTRKRRPKKDKKKDISELSII